QLVEEYESGIGSHKNFWLIAITRDWTEPPQIREAKDLLRKKIEAPRVQWVNWQKIYSTLRKNAGSGNQTEDKLIGNLLSLLKAKGLSTFMQFPKEQLDSIAELWPQVPNFLEEYSALVGTLSSRLSDKNITAEQPIRHGWIATMLKDYAYWMPRWIAIKAWDKKWKEGETPLEGWGPLGSGRIQCLIVLLCLNPLELIAGYRLALVGNENLRELFIKATQSCDLTERLRAFSDYSVTYYDWDLRAIDRAKKDNLSKETFGRE
ncbi:unnamed protein product, partial [marine sediment metagenome]